MTRAFFMLVGNSEQIKEELKYKKDESKRINIKPKKADEIKKKFCKYLNTETEINFTVNELEQDFKILESFNSEYDYRDDVRKVNNNDRISLKKVYPTEEGPKNKMGVYIWEISVN